MAQIKNKFILSVDETTVKLNNQSFLLARNFLDNGDISMFKVNASDNIEAGAILDMGTFNIVTSALVDGIDIAAKAGDTDLNTTHRSSDGSDHSIVGTNTTAIGNAQTEIDNIEGALGAVISAAGAYVAHTGKNYINANASVTEDLIDLDAQVKINETAISGLASATSFQGALDASAIGAQLDDAVAGYYYIVTVAGTLFATNQITLAVGDHLVCTDDAFTGTPTDGLSFSKIDNTESSDILRSGDLTSAQLYVGTSGPTTVTGDVTISNTGVTAIGALKVLDSMIAASTISDGKLASDYIQTSEVDGTTIKFEAAALKTTSFAKENKTLIAGDITNQYVDMAEEAVANSLQLFVSGAHMIEGTDYSLSVVSLVTRITFLGDLATAGASALVATDVLNVSYSYFA